MRFSRKVYYRFLYPGLFEASISDLAFQPMKPKDTGPTRP